MCEGIRNIHNDPVRADRGGCSHGIGGGFPATIPLARDRVGQVRWCHEPETQSAGGLTLSALQRMILQMYGEKDAARGDAATFLWLTEEFGELATALRSGTRDELAAEMADVLAWLATLANIRGIELEEAVLRKYGHGCPGCQRCPVRLRPGREALIECPARMRAGPWRS